MRARRRARQLDEAAAELLDAVLAEAAAAADERVLRDLKKFAFFRAPWRAASTSAALFFAALAAVMAGSCVLPWGLPARMLKGPLKITPQTKWWYRNADREPNCN